MNFSKILKILLSVIMFWLVLRTTNFEKLSSLLLAIPAKTIIILLLCYPIGQILSTYKWWLIARAGGVDASFPVALRSYFVGMFVNCFGFGTVGGDIARGVLLAQDKPQKTEALASVIADRAHGLAVLSFIALVSVVFLGSAHLEPQIVIGLTFLSGAIVAGWFLGPPLVLHFFPRRNRFREKVERVMAVFPKTPSVLIAITAVSLTFHLLQLGLHIVMAEGVGATLSFGLILVTIPFVNIAATLPISWNGLGVREKSYAYFLVPAMLSSEQAIAMGALWLLATTLTAAVGGIIAVLTKDFDRLATQTAEVPQR